MVDIEKNVELTIDYEGSGGEEEEEEEVRFMGSVERADNCLCSCSSAYVAGVDENSHAILFRAFCYMSVWRDEM